MFLITNLNLKRKARLAWITHIRAEEIKLLEQKAVYRYMDELSAQGYDFINPPKVS